MKLARRGLFQGIFALAASGVVAKAAECLPIARAAVAQAGFTYAEWVRDGAWIVHMFAEPLEWSRIAPKTPARGPIAAADTPIPVHDPENAS